MEKFKGKIETALKCEKENFVDGKNIEKLSHRKQSRGVWAFHVHDSHFHPQFPHARKFLFTFSSSLKCKWEIFSIFIPTNIIFYYFKNNWINHTQNWVKKLKLLLLTDKIQFLLTTSLISFHLLIIIKLISSTTSLLTSHWPHEVLLIALN